MNMGTCTMVVFLWSAKQPTKGGCPPLPHSKTRVNAFNICGRGVIDTGVTFTSSAHLYSSLSPEKEAQSFFVRSVIAILEKSIGSLFFALVLLFCGSPVGGKKDSPIGLAYQSASALPWLYPRMGDAPKDATKHGFCEAGRKEHQQLGEDSRVGHI